MKVYGYGEDYESLLLVDGDWVVNGEWRLENKDGVFLHPLDKTPIDVKLLGHIDYDGDYNNTLARFRNGEGQHIKDEPVSPPVAKAPEMCKRKYYGIDCDCSKCRGK